MQSTTNKKPTISACLVVFHEEDVIERCLQSIVDLVDEIIVIHDGPCKDKTIEIAKKYTTLVWEEPHVGIMEAHFAKALNSANSEWIFAIDADEYLDVDTKEEIIRSIKNDIDGISLKWELWNGHNPLWFPGLQKMCIYRKKNYHFSGIPHDQGSVDGRVISLDTFLHHRPSYNNIAWKSFWKKTKKWAPIHASYFFKEIINDLHSFQYDEEQWWKYAKKVRKHVFWYQLWMPLKLFLGQCKNGVWRSKYGMTFILQQSLYQFELYKNIKKFWLINSN